MLNGEMYNPTDPELLIDRENARRLIRFINQTSEDEVDNRMPFLKELFGSTGETYS
jgi:maltose O-acetyltransferase